MAILELAVQDHVALLTINRPDKLNALNQELQQALAAAWRTVRDDDEIWVAILTSAGERAFCAGADLAEMGSRTDPEGVREFLAPPEVGWITPELKLWKPVIAAIRGYCLGGGMALALGCDIRLATPDATFAYPEPRRGIPTITGSLLLPRLMPIGAALEILLTAERIDAQRALALGLINQIVPADELLPTARHLARRICECAPIAVRLTKELALRGLDLSHAEALRLGEAMRQVAYRTEDAAEGPRAFVEKRAPVYRGR